MPDGSAAAEQTIDEMLRGARRKGAESAQELDLRFVNPTGLQDQPIPERQWIVPDWIPCGVATGLYGPGGYGKSLLAQQLLTATAIGRPWIGLPVTNVRSLGGFCEGEPEELHRRQAGINRRLYNCDFRDLGNMRWVSLVGEPNHLMVFDGAVGRLTPL